VTAQTPVRGGLSIRARLALWYAGSMLTVFLVFAVALRGTVRATLQREFTAGIRSSAGAVQSFFRLEFTEYRDARGTIAHIANEVVFPDRLVEFVRPDGVTEFRTGPGPRVPQRAAPGVTALSDPVERITVALDTTSAPGWRLHVSASAAQLESSLARIDRWLVIGIPLGVLLVGITGWWLAGRTLRPVSAMADAATSMAVERRAGSGRESTAAVQRIPIDNPSDELGRLGTRFNALLDDVDGVLQQQRRFLADAAHELRTPVARMIGTVDLSMLDATDPAAQHAALVRVRGDLERTARLVDELLQLARADAADGISPQPTYLDDLVMDCVQFWQPLATMHGVQLGIGSIEEAPVSIDRAHVDRLVGVLLDNAVRYTPPSGHVDVNVTRDGDAALLSIADSGIGVRAADAERVFERFYRGAEARAMSPNGSGLGLAIALWIARAHGATLELRARPEGGTIATVRFPITPFTGAKPAVRGAA
jgi:two-component system, OmpR family, sensor kinase